jgi:hypothetical protein
MQGLIDSLVRSSISPKTIVATESQILRTATSVGGTGATVCFSVPDPICLVYTDPDGREDEELTTYIPREFALNELLKLVVNSDNIEMKAYQRKPFSTNVPKTGLS